MTDTSPESFQPMLDLALQLAREAGATISQMRSTLEINFKYDGSELVTQADVAADTLISNGIRSAFPTHNLLSEELGPDNPTDCEHLWIIDPIDGTVNYAHQHYQAAVSIAYYYKGEAKAAVVHCPFLNETFSALAGRVAQRPADSLRGQNRAAPGAGGDGLPVRQRHGGSSDGTVAGGDCPLCGHSSLGISRAGYVLGCLWPGGYLLRERQTLGYGRCPVDRP